MSLSANKHKVHSCWPLQGANPTSPLFLFQDKEFLKNVLNQSGDEIMVIDRNSLIVYANEATLKGLGYPRDKILNRTITQFFKDRLSVPQWKKEVFAKLKNAKSSHRLTVERVVNGGKIQLIEVTARYFKYGGMEYILSMAREVTERHFLQEQLKKSEELYRLLNEQAGEAIFIVDCNGYIQHLNKAGEDILKLPASKVRGRHFREFVASGEEEKAWESFQLVLRGNAVVRDEIHIINSHKEKIPVEFTASPVYKEGKIQHIHAIARDISRKRQIEKLISEAEKMKAFQNFISGTMHEIYHPLKAIMSHADGLVSKYATRQFEYVGFKEYQDILVTIKNMRNQIKYCVETTDRLININKKKAGLAKKFTNINAVIEELVAKFSNLSRMPDVKILTRLKNNLPLVAMAPLEMNHVVENILTNAVQAITSKGKIFVKTWLNLKEGMVYFQIEDEGVGISKEHLPHVFEPFFTTKSSGFEKSSGLGLSIVYSIVKSHDGTIDIQSSQRRGTIVMISLPVYRNGHRRSKNV